MEASQADAFLVSFAWEDPQNRVIATYEISQPGTKRKVKIPEHCQELGIRFVAPIEMLRQLGESF